MKLKLLLKTLLAASVVSCAAATAGEFTVHHAAGGVSDMVTRTLAQYMPNWTVVNRPGAGGRIAVNHLKNNKAIMVATVNQIFVNNSLSKTPGSADDLEILALVATMPNALVCGPAYPTWEQFIAGKPVMGFGGVGSNEHLATEVLLRTFAVSAVSVPYAAGGSKTLQDLLGGHIDCVFFNYPTVKQHLGTASLHLLATTTNWPQRAKTAWPWPSSLAIVAAKNSENLEETRREIAEVMKQPQLKSQLESMGLTAQLDTSDQAKKQLQQQIQSLKDWIVKQNIKLE